MHRLVVAAALILVVACAAPTPTPSAGPTFSPTATPPPTPTHAPAPTAAPTPTPTTTGPTPTLSRPVQQELEGWQVTCVDVEFVDCHGVAALFVNNLAWSTGAIHDQSAGQVTVTPRPECPSVQDYIDPTFCWQASAPTNDGRVCMIVGRQLPVVPADARRFGFGQVGGDDLTGRLHSSSDPTPQPCI